MHEGDGLFTVHAKARTADGREDEDLGSVPLPDTMKGETRANQILKCVTKSKRRVTLSICGLGMLCEEEIADIPASAKREVASNEAPVIENTSKTTVQIVDSGSNEPVGENDGTLTNNEGAPDRDAERRIIPTSDDIRGSPDSIGARAIEARARRSEYVIEPPQSAASSCAVQGTQYRCEF